ncbi:MAG: hypothetical protein AAFZ63_16910 [Bacteroidota bacterium]
MIRSLLKLGLILVVGILGYNYFFGTAEEKAQSKEIFGKVRDVGKDAWALLKTEKDKFEEGKYNGAVEKVGDSVEGLGELLGKLTKTASDLNDSGALDQLSELQAKQQELQAQIEAETPESYDDAEQERVTGEVQDLIRQTEDLMRSMDQQ